MSVAMVAQPVAPPLDGMAAETESLRQTLSGPASHGCTSPLKWTLSGTGPGRKRRGRKSAKVAPILAVPHEAQESYGFWEWDESLEDTGGSRVEAWLSAVATDRALMRRPPAAIRQLHKSRSRRGQPCSTSNVALKPLLSDEVHTKAAAGDSILEDTSSRQAIEATSQEVGPVVVASTAASPEEAGSQLSEVDKEPWKWLGVTAAIFVAPVGICLAGAVLCPLLAIPAVLAWFMAETVFITYRALQLRSISNVGADIPLPSIKESQELFERVLQLRHTGVATPERFLSRWFHGASTSTMSLDAVTDFLACQFYHRRYKNLPEEHRKAVIAKVARLEELLELRFSRKPEDIVMKKVGIVSTLKALLTKKQEPPLPFMVHTLEPLRAVVHPLATYAWGHAVGRLTVSALDTMGFKRYTCKSTGHAYFMLRRETGGVQGEVDDSEACVFVHGLGVGITPYLPFVHQLLVGTPHKTIVLLELPHLAFRLCNEVPTVEKMSGGLEEILNEHLGPEGKASLIGHSFGSLVAANFSRTRPDRVTSLGLIDPVSILLCLPDVVFNFIYKAPGSMEDMLRTVMVAREMNVAQALCRVFNWHSLLIWADQMPEKCVVMLAGKDSIVPSKEVKLYLDLHGIPVIYNEEMKHAEFIVRPHVQKQFLNALYLGKSAEASGSGRV